MFERMTQGQDPWVQDHPTKNKVVRYGLCPECGNAMQLINIEDSETGPTPHGRHRLKRIPGFDYSLERILGCSLFEPSRRSSLYEEQLRITPEAIQRRDFLVRHFNVALGILQEDIGIELGHPLMSRIFATWLENRWYCWRDAHEGNLPWLLARTTVAYTLFGLRLRPNSETCKAILAHAPETRLGAGERLTNQPGQRVTLQFGLRDHTVRTANDTCEETIVLYVVRPTADIADKPDLIHERTIHLRTEEFLRRASGFGPPEGYGLELVQTAERILDRYLARNPEARTVEAEEAAP